MQFKFQKTKKPLALLDRRFFDGILILWGINCEFLLCSIGKEPQMWYLKNEASDGTGAPAASLADTPEKNDVFTDVLLSNISSVRYDCAGIHKDEASLYLKDSRDAENVLIAMKQMELYLESDTVAPVEQPDTTSLWYGGWSLTFYTKNRETYSLSYGGSNIRLSQTVNGYVHQ